MGVMRAVAYCRVSSEEQVKGFSLDDQKETLRLWCQRNGHEVVEVVRDEGHSGAYLERPGLDRVRDLVEEGGVSLVVAQDADRLTRDPGHRLLLDEELDRRGCRLRALDDWGDESHEGQLLRFLRGWVSKGEGLISMVKLREKLDALAAERESLEARRAMLADGEVRLRELEELPGLMDEYLADLPGLVDRMPVVREYELVGHDYEPGTKPRTLTPDSIRFLTEEELEAKHRAAEAARGARFRELYARLGLRAAVHAEAPWTSRWGPRTRRELCHATG